MSAPYDGSGINQNIPDDKARVKYESVQSAIEKLCTMEPGAFSCKADVLHAFRLLPYHPEDYRKLVFSIGNDIYVNLCAVMGSRSSCQLWERFAKALHHIVAYLINESNCVPGTGGDLAHMLDDFFLHASNLGRLLGRTKYFSGRVY